MSKTINEITKTEAVNEAVTEAPTEATAEASTEATTEAPTKATTEAVTEAPTEATTEATTEADPKPKNAIDPKDKAVKINCHYYQSLTRIANYQSEIANYNEIKTLIESNCPYPELLKHFNEGSLSKEEKHYNEFRPWKNVLIPINSMITKLLELLNTELDKPVKPIEDDKSYIKIENQALGLSPELFKKLTKKYNELHSEENK